MGFGGIGFAGISRLSQLMIDADKDWQSKGISNLKEVAAVMGHGDLVVKTTSTPILIKLLPFYGVGQHFLHCKSIGGGKYEPEWKDIVDVIAYITGGVNKIIDIPTLSIPAPPSISFAVAADASGGGHIGEKTLGIPAPSIGLATAAAPGGGVTSAQALTIPTPSIAEALAVRYAVGGAIAEAAAVQTDETVAANNITANDMTLLPAVPAVNDAYYFGYSALWDWLRLNIGTAGAGVWTIVWEYWNGTAWAALPDIVDGTSHFVSAGDREVTFTRPADWATTAILAITLYWIRARVSAYTSITTQPKGTQAWIWVKQ